MAQDVVEPRNLSALPAPFRTPQKSEKKRLNWLSWMRKSLGGKKKLCACGFYHHHDKDQEWPVFTTQMSSQSGKLRQKVSKSNLESSLFDLTVLWAFLHTYSFKDRSKMAFLDQRKLPSFLTRKRKEFPVKQVPWDLWPSF